MLHEAEQAYQPTANPDLQPISAQKVRILVQQGRVADALDWVRDQSLSVDDDLSFHQEFSHITLARVLLAQFEQSQDESVLHEAMQLLDRLFDAAEAGGRFNSMIEILVLQALVYQAID